MKSRGNWDISYHKNNTCIRCGKNLIGRTQIWLELDSLTGMYYESKDFPKNGLSQGVFMFGITCAEKMIKKGVVKMYDKGFNQN